MHCSRCRSLMAKTHQELNNASRQSWYTCPLCGRAQFVSEPLAPLMQTVEHSDHPPWAALRITDRY